MTAGGEKQGPRPIEDWSAGARAGLVATHGDEMRVLLDKAFSDLLEERDVSLSRYGFNKTDDPVTEAVAWCVERFATGDLDGGQLPAESRSFRLFTQPGFWLAQKVGAQAHVAIQRERRSRTPYSDLVHSVPATSAARDAGRCLAALEEDAARTLSRLHTSTCADMVALWLQGTTKMRSEWFGWDADATVAGLSSASEASKRTADALFRFLVLFWGLLARADRPLSVRVCQGSCFSPCDNAAPYWNDPRVAARPLGVATPSEAKQLRKDGVVLLLGACVERAQDPGPDGEAGHRLRAAFTRRTLKKSVVDLYRLGPVGAELFEYLADVGEQALS